MASEVEDETMKDDADALLTNDTDEHTNETVKETEDENILNNEIDKEINDQTEGALDVDSESSALEKLELETGLNAQMYAKLLGCYVVKGQWKQAQLLYWRMPKSVIEDGMVRDLWTFAKLLIRRDLAGAHQAAANLVFDDKIRRYVEMAAHESQESALNLISQAYVKIDKNSLSALCNLYGNQLDEAMESRKWTLTEDGQFVVLGDNNQQKDEICLRKDDQVSANTTVSTLVDYTSFLEN